jgi:hypothetical protein
MIPSAATSPAAIHSPSRRGPKPAHDSRTRSRWRSSRRPSGSEKLSSVQVPSQVSLEGTVSRMRVVPSASSASARGVSDRSASLPCRRRSRPRATARRTVARAACSNGVTLSRMLSRRSNHGRGRGLERPVPWAHLVGSVPLASAEEVFRTAAAVLGRHLRRIGDQRARPGRAHRQGRGAAGHAGDGAPGDRGQGGARDPCRLRDPAGGRGARARHPPAHRVQGQAGSRTSAPPADPQCREVGMVSVRGLAADSRYEVVLPPGWCAAISETRSLRADSTSPAAVS